MDPFLTENQPETCRVLGLECETCVRKSAASVGKICYGLDSHGVQQLFVQLFPSSGCRPMAPAFELAYLESSGILSPLTAVATAAA
jgi:hypothetical protein